MRAGFVGVLGLPNAGKSSFVNRMVGEKVAIVSSKPQTTRSRIVGMSSFDNGQILWVDSPGWLNRGEGLNKYLMEEFKKTVSDSDALMLLLNLDASTKEAFLPLIEIVKASKKPLMVVVTKTDLKTVGHRKLIIGDWLKEQFNVCELIGGQIFYFSSVKNFKESTAEIQKTLLAALPEVSGHLYDSEIYTTQTQRDLAREIIRERCFENLSDEIPFGLTIQVRKFVESDNAKTKTGKPLTKIFADLVVSKENHKPIVIGSKGSLLKKIGTESRIELEKMIDSSVFLELHVKAVPSWNKNETWLKEFGYVSTQQ